MITIQITEIPTATFQLWLGLGLLFILAFSFLSFLILDMWWGERNFNKILSLYKKLHPDIEVIERVILRGAIAHLGYRKTRDTLMAGLEESEQE